jgi:hypothetical protein
MKRPRSCRTAPLSSQYLYRKSHIIDNNASSLASTVSERYDSEQEFTVDRILAEKPKYRRKFYLIRWEGYLLEKSI